jgi:hypothetical protein
MYGYFICNTSIVELECGQSLYVDAQIQIIGDQANETITELFRRTSARSFIPSVPIVLQVRSRILTVCVEKEKL